MQTIYSLMSGMALLAGFPIVAGALATMAFGRRRHIQPSPGLLFHSLHPSPGANMSYYPTGSFRRLLELFSAKGIKTISVRDQMLQEGTGSAAEIALTFDDGFESFIHYAVPTLQEFGCGATVYAVAGFLGSLSTWDVFPGVRHVTVSQLREIAQSGFEVGSHTMTHPNLTFLEEEDLRRELGESKRIIEDITGKEVTSISFPHGSWNMHVWETALELGYRNGTVYRGENRASAKLMPVYGVYRFDSPETIINRIAPAPQFSPELAISRIMAHFAKGTPIWCFRKSYHLIPRSASQRP